MINMMGANYPKKPEEMTFAYKWAKFKQKFHKKGPEGEKESSDAPEEVNTKEDKEK